MSQDVPQFEDFELLVSAAQQPGRYPVNVIKSQAGNPMATLALDPAALKDKLAAIASRNTTEDSLREFGGQLFTALFADQIRSAYAKSQGIAETGDKQLRVRLRIEPPELSALPWEYLYDPEADLALAISKRHCLSRFLSINEPITTEETEPPLRVLIVVSDPSDLDQYGLPPLKADAEIKHIQQELQSLGGMVVTDILPHAVASDLQDKLRKFHPHVVHLIGHGTFQNNRGMLVMESDSHTARLMSDRQFREFFLDAEDTKLVVLNACEGATQSSVQTLAGLAPQLVRRRVGAVVAMQYPIRDEVALVFAREFYRTLAQYYPVDAAATEGRRAIYLESDPNVPDWGTPVIFMRSPDGVLFSPPQTVSVPKPSVSSGGVSIQSSGSVHIGGSVAGSDLIHEVGVGSPPGSGGQLPEIAQLVNVLTARFDVNELESLSFDLGIDWSNLEGRTRDTKIRSLVDYMRRHSRLPELANHIRQIRADIQW